MAEEPKLPWVVEFEILNTSGTARLTIPGNVVIGRADHQTAFCPDFDLSPWGGMELGAAIRHVMILPAEDQLMIMDLDSGKPTLLNGRRLTQTPYALNHGDVLQLGVLHLRVNIVSAPVAVDSLRQKPEFGFTDDPAPGRGQTVLIVEDEAETAEIFRLIIEKAGFKAIVCREVVSAIRVLNTETPSAIILDLMLPDIHGLELCRYVRRDTSHSEVPIVVVSAAAKPSTISQAMEVGADVFLAKPFSMRDLVRVVASLVCWHESRFPAESATKQLPGGTGGLGSMPGEMRRDAVVFFVGGYDEPIAVVVQSRITIGRRSGSTSRRPHVDLERYGAFEAGVSRIHAALYRTDEGFLLEDLGSSNGTFINNVQLEPEHRYPLANATEFVLGTLPLRIYFFTEADSTMLPSNGDAA